MKHFFKMGHGWFSLVLRMAGTQQLGTTFPKKALPVTDRRIITPTPLFSMFHTQLFYSALDVVIRPNTRIHVINC